MPLNPYYTTGELLEATSHEEKAAMSYQVQQVNKIRSRVQLYNQLKNRMYMNDTFAVISESW